MWSFCRPIKITMYYFVLNLFLKVFLCLNHVVKIERSSCKKHKRHYHCHNRAYCVLVIKYDVFYQLFVHTALNPEHARDQKLFVSIPTLHYARALVGWLCLYTIFGHIISAYVCASSARPSRVGPSGCKLHLHQSPRLG